MKYVIAVFAAILAACHSHNSDPNADANARRAAETLWPGNVESVVCGPCPCPVDLDCSNYAQVTCVVRLSSDTGISSTRVILCEAENNGKCAVSSTWAEQHMDPR